MQKILKHHIYICYLKQTQELLKKCLIIKTKKELLVQDKKIKEYIICKNLSFDEQTDVDTVTAIKYNIKLFF